MKFPRRSLLTSSLASLATSALNIQKLSGQSVPTAKFVNVDGIRTRYFEHGTGKNLVLIHGGRFGFPSYSADVWDLNIAGLSKYFHVYAFDKLGQGYTDNPPNDASYTKRAYVHHAQGFIRAMGIKRVSLVGHSMGAMVAARIAVENPELVENLIILDSNTLAPQDPSTPRGFYDKVLEGAPDLPTKEYVRREPDANSYSNAHVTDDYVTAILKIALLPKTIEATQQAVRLNPLFFEDLASLKAETMEWIKDGRLKAPTLILWGFNDVSAPVILGMHLLRVIAPVVPRTDFHVINEAAHYLFREKYEEVNHIITDFIQTT
ncbi:MAG: alpha/beta hydrolase [Acidobacteriota bacterium]|nr:alpha/beta hydrolase [Acidobacteriota bacterium]